ncbi:MAG: type 4a pilus biogenesis protein PilO [bacterium]|nr:type 4a pilus biogenesis protein PilO [bacterium]
MSPHVNISLGSLKSPRGRLYYYLIAGNVVILALIGFFVLRPVFGALSAHADEIAQTKGDIATLRQKTDDLRQLKETLPATQAAYGGVIQNAPKTKDIAGYQTELEELAALTRTTLVTVDTTGAGPDGQTPAAQTVQTAGGFPTFPVKMDVTGAYASVLDFLNRLETMDRFTRVTSVSINQADGAGGVKLTITAQSIYFGT